MSKAKRRERKRDSLYAAWVILLIAFGAISTLAGILQGSAIGIVTSLIVLACSLGLWYWQRWGYYGILVCYAIVVVVIVVAGAFLNLIPLIGSLAIIGITYLLVQPRLPMFD